MARPDKPVPARGPRSFLHSCEDFLPATALRRRSSGAMLRRLEAPSRGQALADLADLAARWQDRRASWGRSPAGSGARVDPGLDLAPGFDEAGTIPVYGLPWGRGFEVLDSAGRWPLLELRRRLRATPRASRALIGDGRSLLLIDAGWSALRGCRMDLAGLVEARADPAAAEAWRWACLMLGDEEAWSRARVAWERERQRWARRVAASLRAATAGYADRQRGRQQALRAVLSAVRGGRGQVARPLPAVWKRRLDEALEAGGLPLAWGDLRRPDLACLLAELYAEAGRRSGGVYFTPEPLAESVAGEVIAHCLAGGRTEALRCCDPACGDGRFLIAAAEALALARFDGGAGAPRPRLAALRAAAAAMMSGVEKDPAIAELAALSLEDYAGARGRIQTGDGLERGARGACDAVLGNPPYRAFYARGSRRRHGEAPRPGPRGRSNDFLLFLDRAQALAHPERGFGALVLPDALVANASYEKERRALCRSGRLRAVDVFRSGLFPGAQVGTAVVLFGPPRPAVSAAVDLAGWSGLSERAAAPRPLRASAAELLARPACRWLPVSAARLARAFLAPERSRTLAELVHLRDGINPGPREARERLLSSEDDGGGMMRPCLAGRDIHPFAVTRPGLWVRDDPAAISEASRRRGTSLREAWVFERPRLVYRQTAPRIIAAVVLDGTRALNSVHNLILRAHEEEALFALCAYLNSAVFNEAYALVSGETRWLFPQVHIATLKGLRVPRALVCPGEPRRRLGELARSISRGARGPRQLELPAPSASAVAEIEELCAGLAEGAAGFRAPPP